MTVGTYALCAKRLVKLTPNLLASSNLLIYYSSKKPLHHNQKKSVSISGVVVEEGKGKTIAGVPSQYYHRNITIAILSSQFYHRRLLILWD